MELSYTLLSESLHTLVPTIFTLLVILKQHLILNYVGIFNAALGSPPTQSHDTPVYAYPTSNPSKFKVSRLIRYTDGAGQILDQDPVTNQFLRLNARRHIFNIDNPNFNVAYSDVLLHMETPNQMDLQWMKNYAGQIGLVPRCILQYIKFPFGLPSGVPLVEQGVKLNIAFTNTELFNQNGHQHFDDMTPLLVMKRYVKKEDNTTGTRHVVDVFTNRARHVAQSALDRPLERPWDVLVAEDTLRTLSKDMGRMRGTIKPGLPPKFQFVDLPDWNAANPYIPGEAKAYDAETRDTIELQQQTLPQNLQPGQAPASSPYDWRN